MAHTKAGGSTRQQGNRSGKRLGVKIFSGQHASSGNILIRQKGSKFNSGYGVKTGKDFTLYAVKEGIVKHFIKHKKRFVGVFDNHG